MKSPITLAVLFCLAGLSLSATILEENPIVLDAGRDHGHDHGYDAEAPAYRDTLLSLHRSLVEIPSISGTENKVGSFLVDYLTARGYIAQLQFLPPNKNTPAGAERFNVLAWPGPTRDPRPRVLVTSHIDVVPPYIPYAVSPDNDVIGPDTVLHGRGSVDAKASVAAQIVAVEELLARGDVLRRGSGADNVMLLFVVGEETTGDGMRHFSAELSELNPPRRFEAAIFGEPTEGKLACGHKGIGVCTVRAHGKAGHSGYPWLGKSATALLVRALDRLLDADLGSSKRFGNTTVNVGVLEGGVAANVIPQAARASLAIRIAAGNQSTGFGIVQNAISDILNEVDAEALTWGCEAGYGPIECNCDVDGFDTIVVNYGTDVPNLEGSHTRYLYGPGNILVAHGDNEALTVAQLEAAVEGYKRLIVHALKA